jgi:glutamyl-tRNA reductase
MLGESQVLGQVKGAFRTATDAGVAGPRLTTLFTQAFRTAKRVRTETMLSRRPVSLVSLAERSLRARLEACPGPVAIVGAGEMANQALELVRKLAPERPVTLFNRTRDRGSSLAAQYAATYRPLGELGDGGEFTAVIAATSSELPVITPEVARRLAPALLLDFGLPPNVSGECRAVDGIELVDQEVLRGEAEANRSARAEELSKSEQIVEEQLQELSYEVMEHELSPVARRLVTTFRDLARVELARVAADSGTVPADAIEEAAERLSQRLVRVPMRGLREVAWHHSTDVLNTFLDAVQQ